MKSKVFLSTYEMRTFFFQRKPSKAAVVCLCSLSVSHPKALKEKLALKFGLKTVISAEKKQESRQ